jgi:hypothetical protein
MRHSYHFIMLRGPADIHSTFIRFRRLAGLVAILGFHAAAAGGVGAQEGALQWRVQGGEKALEPTARVRLIVDNRLPADVADPILGLVQTAIYLYPEDSPAAERVAAADGIKGMNLAAEEPLFSSASTGDRLATVRIGALADEDVALALVIGRAVPVVSAPEAGSEGVPALRAVGADLADRLRWSADTLIGAGRERQVWEGNVVLVANRIYTDFLAVRSVHYTQKIVAGSEAARVDTHPVGGILDISPTATPMSVASLPAARGTLLVRAAAGRLNALSLTRGMLNVIRITAEQSATGDFVVRVSAETEPLSSVPAR